MALSTVRRTHPSIWIPLGIILLLFAAMSAVGITWGLPSRNVDKYLFGDGDVWSGEKIYRLAKADAKFSPTRGADVDADPVIKKRKSAPSPQPSPLKGEGVSGDEPIPLTATDEDVAKIYLRYRLYTYQPDEMITMMALAGMRPSKLDFDPRLYQYGGLFIYPVGALIKLCGLLGLIDVRSDVVYYLDDPDAFGKFYIVARAYSAAWGLIGVIVVYAIAKRLALIRTPSASAGSWPVACAPGSDRSHRAGLLAALLFTLMPVVVCMAHEGKPHLPGAVLMLLAVLFAMRRLQAGTPKFEVQSSKFEDDLGCHPERSEDDPHCHPERSEGSLPGSEMLRYAQHDTRGIGNRQSAIGNWQFYWWMCVCCGAALGMVLSSWPVFILIPLIAFRAANGSERTVPRFPRDRMIRMLTGTALALGVYLVTNPYVLFNAFANREVLKSNFTNSLAMYEIARIGEGFVRTVELTIEGATLPVLVVGLFALVVAIIRKNRTAIPLIVVAVAFFLQFVLIGAGKPAEYGRFGIFTNTALAIGTAGIVVGSGARPLPRWSASIILAAWVAWGGTAYLRNFWIDTGNLASRLRFAEYFSSYPLVFGEITFVVPADPAPYNLPPLPFHDRKVFLARPHLNAVRAPDKEFWWLIHPVDSTTRLEHHSPDDAPEAFVFTYPQSRVTPISWANKPFVIENTVGPAEDGRSIIPDSPR